MPFKKLKGRKLMLCDMIYQRGSKKTEWKDYLTVTYRDLITNKKEKMTIEEPKVNLFTVKPEYRTFGKQRHHLPIDQLEVKEVKYRNILYEISKIAGEQYVDYYKNHNTMKEKKKVLKYPYVMGGDIDIETYYRVLWDEEVDQPERCVPNRIFLDIEVDQINYEGNIARHGECEVNAVSVVDEQNKTVYQFLYDNGNNPLIKDFVAHQKEFQQSLHDTFDESYGVLDYKIYMFTDEREMLRQLFNLIHSLCKDFCLIWNMGFDIPYLIDRIKVLGMDPEEVMCGHDWKTNTLYYYEDKFTFEFANKRDYFQISDMTHYSDQMINFAGLRKSQGTVKKVNLGSVAQTIIKDTKLDYSDAGNIRTLPYENYVMFAMYSIKDTLLQMGIDRKTHDIENIYMMSMTNTVPYKDVLKQTVVFRSLMYKYLKSIGMVLGHNVNFDAETFGKFDENGDKIYNDDDEDEDVTFEGAVNGDPMLNMANGISLYGCPSKFLYGLTIDFDFSSRHMDQSTVKYWTNLSNCGDDLVTA